VVVSGDSILNEDGLRYSDEFVRHKVLDAMGDLYLAGGPIVGRFHGQRSGHALNRRLLQGLLADSKAWRYTTLAAVPASATWDDAPQRATA
jgi:UDP-3-O-[3-hydroxymyristoyl] N-acetylglucosamine deacetylase